MTDCIFFLFNHKREDTLRTLASILAQPAVGKVVVFSCHDLPPEESVSDQAGDRVEVVGTNERNFMSSAALDMVSRYESAWKVLYTKTSPLQLGYRCVERMMQAGNASQAARVMVYADRYETLGGKTLPHPVIDRQAGGVRNDFDYGSLMMFNDTAVPGASYRYAGLYFLQLHCIDCIHIPEYLYTEQESDTRKSGEKQFDYVNPAMREVQVEMERAFTRSMPPGCLITTDMIRNANLDVPFRLEASVIIPVRNREKTIGDAIRSALGQQTTFAYNVIVVDNHSDDNTGSVIEAARAGDDRVVHLVPQQTDLGIGGCWDLAIRSEHCGKFAVQLDSDDLYSGSDTLQKIVDKFYETNAAMVIGSYSLVDFNLNPLPPGLIDHREWTDRNGMNNALRINGLGAPRAFFTPVLRQVGFPNTSYGEDYAVGLAISRRYKIGRVYDNLYLCRRWDGNSDAALSVDKVNRNNYYKDWIRSQEMRHREMEAEKQGLCHFGPGAVECLFDHLSDEWPEVALRISDLDTKVERQTLQTDDGITLEAQYNPARVISTNAKVDKESIGRRRCFLCEDNQPREQHQLHLMGRYHVCVNPYPILHRHLTLPLMAHKPQVITQGGSPFLSDFVDFVRMLGQSMVIFYNGAYCGASAPDHHHLQAGALGEIPLQRDFGRYRAGVVGIAGDVQLVEGFAYPLFMTASLEGLRIIVSSLPVVGDEPEARFNLMGWGDTLLVIPRRKLRPECYYAEGDDNMCISPGAVDMGGLIITPFEKDYRRLTPDVAAGILREVTLTREELQPVIERIKTTLHK